MNKNYVNAVKATISFGVRKINLNHKFYLDANSALSDYKFIFFLKKIPFALKIFKFLESNSLVNRDKCYEILNKISCFLNDWRLTKHLFYRRFSFRVKFRK